MIRECGNLPLALAMIGAQLRGKPIAHWSILLGHLGRADLARIKARFPEPHTTLLRAIEISVDALREQDSRSAECYLALAVLLEEMVVHPVVQQMLWNVNAPVAHETAELLITLSLAQRDLTRARNLYEPINGFSNVSRHLQQVDCAIQHSRAHQPQQSFQVR